MKRRKCARGDGDDLERIAQPSSQSPRHTAAPALAGRDQSNRRLSEHINKVHVIRTVGAVVRALGEAGLSASDQNRLVLVVMCVFE